MSAQFKITSTFGATVPDGCSAKKATQKQTVEIDELVGPDAEYLKADPFPTVKTEVTVNGAGGGSTAVIASSATITPATLSVIKSDATEKNKGRAEFTDTWTGYASFTDSGSGVGSTGSAAPDDTTLIIVSVSYSLTESFSFSPEVEDMVATSYDGTPGARGTCKNKAPMKANGKGSLPSGLALGSGGIGCYEATGGKTLVPEITLSQIAGEWNTWDVSGTWYPFAA